MGGLNRESEITLERIRKILATGANVILTTKGIDDLCLKEFVEAGAMAVRRCKKEDLKRIARATGATLVSSLANLEGEETFESSLLGSAEEVVQDRVGDDELILVKGTKVVSSASLILRGANGASYALISSCGLIDAFAAQTICWMRWKGRCMMPCVSLSGHWKAVQSYLVEEQSRQRFPSTSKTLLQAWWVPIVVF